MTEATKEELHPSPTLAIEPRRNSPSRRTFVLLAAGGVVLALVLALFLYHRSARARRQQEALLKSTLDKLVTAQEGFYYDSARYVTSLRSLGALTVPSGVRVQLAPPIPRSWSAVATHSLLPGRHCVVWVGSPPTSLPDDARAPENETKPLCFDDAERPR